MTLGERAILQAVLDGDRSFTGMGAAALRTEALALGMRPTAIADRSPKGRDLLGSVHESGGAEGNRTNSVGYLLHKRSD